MRELNITTDLNDDFDVREDEYGGISISIFTYACTDASTTINASQAAQLRDFLNQFLENKNDKHD